MKQVILIRKDLNMRRGKEIAQGSHASMDFLVAPLRAALRAAAPTALPTAPADLGVTLTPEERAWITHGMAKVCLRVDSGEELLERHRRALEAGLKSHLILDSGRTEFGGVPTYTACAIGPHAPERIDPVTGDLVLY